MPDELFTVCALPHSCARRAEFHVSLFVSPRLTPGAPAGAGEVLDEYRLFSRWASSLVDGTTIELSDQHGVIECSPQLGAVRPDVWLAAFPPDTPVRGQPLPEWDNRRWRSFRAAHVHDWAKLIQAAGVYADPTTPPAPSAHPLTRLMAALTDGWYRTDTTQGGRQRVYDESIGTREFDALIESGEQLEVIERIIADEQDPMRRIALELHRARRFYERPESQHEYRERPVEGLKSPRPDRPVPDFHERCALAGDHPALLRALGLVIDLTVDDPDRLRRSSWLSAVLAVDGDSGACRKTRTSCRALDDDLVTVPESAEWIAGFLAVGNPDLFALLDMEADGAALKLERYLWTLPRLLAVEQNGNPVSAATPAQRSAGFTLVRHSQAIDVHNRLGRQKQLLGEMVRGDPPLLSSEDVARGIRTEVWDDTAKRWFSLHSRLVDVLVDGFGTVVDDAPEEGFIQGTPASESSGVADSPVHVHEAVFGWEGWSLSAPRPGRRVRHEDGDEIVEDSTAVPDAVTPVVITTRVAPGTLPRLRFGRSYAFRAWLVDLAGNVRPHELNPPALSTAAVEPALAARLGAAGVDPAVERGIAVPAAGALRAETHAGLESLRMALAAPAEAKAPLDLGTAGPDDVTGAVLGRLRSRLAGRPDGDGTPAPAARRRVLVGQAFARALADPAQPFGVDTAAIRPAALAPVVASSAGHLGSPAADGNRLDLDAVLATITPLRPFLRWDPVPSPSVVPLERFSEGESLRVLVVRSGVTQDPATLALTVTPPAVYAADVAAVHPTLDLRYGETNERHLAPPKTSQFQAELHGRFDDAIASADPAEHVRLLAVALRESGTLFDLEVVNLADATTTTPQPGVRLESNPGPPQAPPKTLPLKPGDPPAPGQYVVHDTPQLVLPYLPDSFARGVSLAFPDAGRDRRIRFPFGGEGCTAAYNGAWPEIEPFRFVLAGGDDLSGAVDGNVITVDLPAGDQLRFRLASTIAAEDLDLLGPWRNLADAVRSDPDVIEAAVDGWLWALTPYEDVLLVHAVPRPLEAPRPTVVRPSRQAGSTECVLGGAVDLHGPSTDTLTAEAAWVEPLDDVTLLTGPEEHPQSGVAFTTPILPYEDLAILWAEDGDATVENVGRIRLHRAVHQFGDTHHRVVDYTFRASTRFREYFHPDLLAPDTNIPGDDGRSVVGPSVRVSVPSTARPAAPVVHSVVPLFRWADSEEPEQPFASRRVRRAGLRIYLERPWFSSGQDELLGVLLAEGGNDSFGPPPPDQSGFPFVSKWGADPAWVGAPVPTRAMGPLLLDNVLAGIGFDDRHHPARPVTPARLLPLAAVPGAPTVNVVGYKPQYNHERNLWYVDVAIDPGDTFWPFVRLAVARYQPESLDGCHLSAPVRCDYVQLAPTRTTSVSRTDDHHVRVVVSGPIGVRSPRFPANLDDLRASVEPNHQVVVRLQRRDPAIPTDLGWETVATEQLTVQGTGPGVPDFEVAWVGAVEAPVAIPLRRPGSNADWRVTVEEWELLPGDPVTLAPAIRPLPAVWERRLVYADEVSL
ncbi:MAG: hypothetical protein ACR2MO_01965 [Acidimicrobiales bacterium]